MTVNNVRQNNTTQNVQQTPTTQALSQQEVVVESPPVLRAAIFDRLELGFDERTAFFPPVDLDRILSMTDEEFAELRAERLEAMLKHSPVDFPGASNNADVESTSTSASNTEVAQYLVRVSDAQDEALQSIAQTLGEPSGVGAVDSTMVVGE